ncbi:MAG: 50S ribosomal protein L6 [Candidatus Woesearchaeota archaeon]
MKLNIEEVLELPQGVTIAIEHGTAKIKGPKGEIARRMVSPGILISANGQKVTLKSKKATKREKKMLYTFLAHLKNMVRGVQQPWVYKLKICSGHFPMTAAVSGNKFALKNFLGEKVPRECTIPAGVEVKVAGQEITVTGVDRELAGQTAGLLELLTFKSNKDLRTFQDGIYITQKPGKEAEQ